METSDNTLVARIVLEKAFTERLQTAEVDEYRRNYLRFRKGKANGAKGEGPGDADPEDDSVAYNPDEEPMEDMFEFEAEGMNLYEQIMGFRVAYRRYRTGHSRGAKGDVSELSKKLSVAHARILPVAELGTLLYTQTHPKLMQLTGKSTFHLHIGAGRLGLGLVVPAIIASEVPFAILQRPSRYWEPLIQSSATGLKLKINGESLVDEGLLVVRNFLQLPTSEEFDRSMFVPSDDPLLIHLLVAKATSFSIALGGPMLDVVLPLFAKYPVAEPGAKVPCLYACENDHKMVHELQNALHGKVDVITCMVDRICVDRNLKGDCLDVTCEPYEGEIVVLKQPDNALPPPLEGEHVRVPDLDSMANYFCRRKFLLVNGTHTTLAFMTLCLNEKSEHSAGDYQLIDWDVNTCGPKLHEEIWAWAVARLLMIMWEHEIRVLKHAHHVDSDEELCDVLLNHTVKTLRRFSSIKDTTSRVLQGGIANRWETRLKAVDVFLAQNRLDAIETLLLKRANIQYSYMKKVVRRLCDESKRFTGLHIQPAKVICT